MSEEAIAPENVTSETKVRVSERVEEGFKVVTTTTEVRTPLPSESAYKGTQVGFGA